MPHPVNLKYSKGNEWDLLLNPFWDSLNLFLFCLEDFLKILR